jgi:hypothetical protein
MLLEQIIKKQEQQTKNVNSTPLGEVWSELERIKEDIKDQQCQGNCTEPNYEIDEAEQIKKEIRGLRDSFNHLIDKLSEESPNREQILDIIDDAMEQNVPVMPQKVVPESGVRVLGLPIPLDLREDLLIQKQRYDLASYKAAVLVAMRIGVKILEGIEYT